MPGSLSVGVVPGGQGCWAFFQTPLRWGEAGANGLARRTDERIEEH
jgi:hypothetical protein